MIVGWPNGWPGWPNGWVFVYKLSGSGFESSCSCKFKIYDAQHENNDLNWIYNSGQSILTIGCFIVQAWFTQVTWHLLSIYYEPCIWATLEVPKQHQT